MYILSFNHIVDVILFFISFYFWHLNCTSFTGPNHFCNSCKYGIALLCIIRAEVILAPWRTCAIVHLFRTWGLF